MEKVFSRSLLNRLFSSLLDYVIVIEQSQNENRLWNHYFPSWLLFGAEIVCRMESKREEKRMCQIIKSCMSRIQNTTRFFIGRLHSAMEIKHRWIEWLDRVTADKEYRCNEMQQSISVAMKTQKRIDSSCCVEERHL